MMRVDFAPWHRESVAGSRHPVDDVMANLRQKLGSDIIPKGEWGRGYRLDEKIPVTEIAGPSVKEAERLRAIALDRMNVFTLESLRSSIASYEEVLQHGPDADAYANLAMNYINEGHTGFCLDLPQRTIPKARKLLEEALRHYPTFSSAYALRALTHLIYDYDWKQADADLKRAFDLNHDDEYGHVVAAHMKVAQGRFDNGLAHAKRAAELDWRSPMTVFTVPWMHILAGRTDEALLQCVEALNDFDPFAVGHIIHGYAWEAAGVGARAITEYKKSMGIAVFPDGFASLGHAYGLGGDARMALSCLDNLRAFKEIAYVSGYYEALIYIALGKKKEAMDALENAFTQKCDWLIYLKVEPRWKPLRDEKKFIGLLERVGLQ